MTFSVIISSYRNLRQLYMMSIKLNTSLVPEFLAIALIISLFLPRIYKLNSNPVSLFSDEVDIAYQAKSFRETGKDYFGKPFPLQFRSFSDVRTSLPIYSTIALSYLPGVTIDEAVRLSPAVFSLISLIGIYLLSSQIFKQKTAGLFSVLILGSAPWHYTYSRTGFELSMLICFFIFGFYFFLLHRKTHSKLHFFASMLLFSLTPAIYSTAKLSIIFIPLLLLLLIDKPKLAKTPRYQLLGVFMLFLPLLLIVLSGGSSQRFQEIAIHTDPTLPTEVNYNRQLDLGKNLKLGSTPSFTSKLYHNRLSMISTKFFDNIYSPLSSTFLFVAGDQNLRHAVPGWGMLLKSMAIPLLVGIYFLIKNKDLKLSLFFLALSLLAIVPSSLTRDGSTHSSRTFLLLLPLVLVASRGLSFIFSRSKILALGLSALMVFEFSSYLHTYWYHYPVLSERSFHAGLKELTEVSKEYPNQAVILTRTYEPTTIFFLYYGNLPIPTAQSLISSSKLTQPLNDDLNLEGVRVTGTNIYLASVRDTGTKDPLKIKDAVYALPSNQATDLINKKQATKIKDIYLPSGELIYSVIKPVIPQVANRSGL